VRFLSVEPLLGPVDLDRWLEPLDHCNHCGGGPYPAHPRNEVCPSCGTDGLITTWGAAQAERWETGERYDQNSVEGRADLAGTSPMIDWVIVGGESGPGARPCAVEWIAKVVEQCDAAGVAVFVKQLGAVVTDGRPSTRGWNTAFGAFEWEAPGPDRRARVHLVHKKGGDPSEWPESLRIREFPEVA
jgi:hypothetical protein